MHCKCFALSIFALLFVVDYISAKKRGKSDNKLHDRENWQNSEIENLPDVDIKAVDNRTRYAITQHVKSKKLSCTRDNINEMSRSVKCKPRLTVVELLFGIRNRFIPNAVLAKRCSGGCEGFQRCLPKRSVNSTFFVKEMVKDKTYCSAIPISEDLECECTCIVKLKDCSAYQYYSPNTCTCKCENEDDFHKCRSSMNKNMKWNDRKCTCECVESKFCTMGTVWDSARCKCIKTQR